MHLHLPKCLILPAFLACSGLARADIAIGLAGPLSGANAQAGLDMKHGLEAAIGDINAQGGVLHQKLVLDVEDDACDPRLAVAAAQRLAERGVGFVFGHYCSAATLPASSVYADRGILEITISSGPLITQQGYDGLFRLTGRDDQQGAILADLVARRFAGEGVAILADRSAYGTSLAAAVRPALVARKISVVFDQSIDADTQDLTTVIDRLKALGARVAIVAGYSNEAGLLARQAAGAGLKLQFLSGSALANHRYWDVAGSAAEGTLFTFVADAAALPSARPVVERLRAAGVPTQGYVLYAYAALQIFADAMERAQSAEPEAVDAAIEQGKLPTVLGDVSFDENGDNTAPNWRVYRWTGGRFEAAD